jgi:hypothetical protein
MSRRRPPLRQLGHVLYEVGFVVFSLVSRVINATIYRGSMYQTLSARTYMDAHPPWMAPEAADASVWVAKWRRREALLNRLMRPLGREHCRAARDADVLRMNRGLNRYGEGPDPDQQGD